MIPTSYSRYTRGSFWKTAILTTVLALCHAFLFAQTTCDADAGSLNGEICIQNQEVTLKATLRGDTVVPDGYQVLYVLTRGDSLIITEVSENASFSFMLDELQGVYTIHTLVYDSTTLDLDGVELGVTPGLDLFNTFVAGGGTVCAALDTAGVKFRFGNCDDNNVNECTVDAGTVSIDGGGSTITFCPNDGEEDIFDLDNSGAVLDSGTYVYLVTDTSNVVTDIITDASVNFETVDSGTYRIYGYVYTADSLGIATGDTLSFNEPSDSNCTAVSGNFITVTVNCDNVQPECDATVGITSGNLVGCLDGDSVTLSVTVQTPPTVPTGYSVIYVLTSGDNLVIQQASATPSFNVDSAGTYRIHVLVYDSTTLNLNSIVFGQTTGGDVNLLLAQGGGDICGALDVTGVDFTVRNCDDFNDTCIVSAGALRIVNEDYCFDGDSAVLTAAIQSAPVLGPGFDVLYVLTTGDSLIIRQVDTIPSFTVETLGQYRISALVYDTADFDLIDSLVVFGQTSALGLLPFSVGGGGTICAAFDTVGVVFDVMSCDQTGGPDSCNITTGVLSPAGTSFCIDSTLGVVTLAGTIVTQPTAPAGYQILYLLASGDSLTIQQSSTSPSFIVDTTGTYTIHILVYDPETFDPDSSITFGTTTGTGLDSLLVQGGGSVCGGLDVEGLQFNVVSCTDSTGVDSCGIALGTLRIVNEDYCFDGDSAILTATPQTDPTVPAGFDVLYVLTTGDSLIIQQIDTIPSFTVETLGQYRISTLVYDTADFDLLDSLVVFDQTSALDLLSLSAGSGGNTCTAFDTVGVVFDVMSCDSTGVDSCGIALGTLRIVNEDYCFNGDSAILTATPQTDPTVPAGFDVLYVLTTGDSLIIRQVDTIPSFTVETLGQYRISTLVYDTADFDLLDSLVVFGQTSALDLLPLSVGGGGTICAAFDTAGVVFDVMSCDQTGGPDSCNITTGILSPAGTSFCIDSTLGVVTLAGTIVTQPTAPNGYQILYLLASGDSLTIQQSSTSPSFIVDTTGTYTIHILVYDPETFNPDSSITFGTTTGTGLDSLLVQGGGNICGGLDVQGLEFTVINCNDFADSCIVSAGALRIVNEDYCFDGDSAVLTAAIQSAPVLGPGFDVLYVLTTGDSLIIRQIDTIPSFTVETLGQYRISALVYDTADFDLLDSLVVFGQTSALDLLPFSVGGGGTICAAFDTAGVVFDVMSCDETGGPDSCNITTGILSPAGTSFCIDSTLGVVTLAGTIVTQPTAPAGYQILYLLASGDSLTIQQSSTSPSFIVDTTGTYTIHILVYDPETFNPDSSITFGTTNAAGLDSLLVQGGGDICGGLDVEGLQFNVVSCTDTTGTGGVDSCNVSFNVGKLQIVGNDVRCYEDNSITTPLIFTRAPMVPDGFAVAFVVSENGTNTITQVTNNYAITVNGVGIYRVQTLIYDSTTLSLNGLVGQTTTDLNGRFIQGGGNRCAAFDTTGIVFVINDCTGGGPDSCSTNVKTGTLSVASGSSSTPCLSGSNAEATLTATVTTQPTVPTGYNVIYLLTSGNNMVIEEMSDDPSFTVNGIGNYRIQVLVYDPGNLTLSSINLGTTTIAQLNGRLVQGGGSICAALSVTGVSFDVRDCGCGANPGELTYTRPNGRQLCLNNNGLAFLAGNTRTRAIVPSGYQRVYVLTSGNNMVIERVADIPVFGVRETGTYRIHTLIYDPSTLNLNSIQLGVTTAAQINALLRQGGGDICAALEMPGLVFNVGNCAVENGISAFPNPATTQLNVTLPKNNTAVERVNIQMIDMNGNIAKQWNMDGYNPNTRLDISDIQPGMYYIRVLYDQEFVEEMNIVKVR